MSLLLLYLLLLKATVTSFSGLASLPVVHADLVVKRRVLSEVQLNTAVAAARSGPGPIGAYVVCAGYFAAGWPGAAVGWLAMVTPAFFAIGILRLFARRADHPAVRRVIRAVLLASAGLLISSSVSLAQAALINPLTIVVALVSGVLLAVTRVETLIVIAAAAAVGALASLIGL